MPWRPEKIPQAVTKFFTMLVVHKDIRDLVNAGDINKALDLARTRSAKVTPASRKILQIANSEAMKRGTHVTASEYLHARALLKIEKRPRRTR
jgi:hypothetical protein